MDKLPNGWNNYSWNDVLEVKNGKNQKAVLDENGKYPIYGSGGIMAYANDYLCDEGTTIIGRKGTINNPIYVESKFWNVDTAFGISPKSELNSKLLFYFCLSYDFTKHNKSTTLPSLTKSDLLKIQIPLPPLSEQKRIVSKLDALFERIDKSIALLEENIKQTEHLMASALDEVFKMFEIENDSFPLSDCVIINSGIALPKIFKENQNNGVIPFYKVAQMNNDPLIMKGAELTFSIELSKEHKIKIFPKGSVLIPKRGGAILTNKKRLLLEDASYDSNVMGLFPKDFLSSKFLFYFMQHIDLGNFIDESTIPQINNKHIKQMIIPVPSIEFQDKAVKRLETLSAKTQSMMYEQQVKLNNLKALKESILDKAFKGEL